MNFVSTPVWDPVKVLVTNPLTPIAQMTIMKILSGQIFGRKQLIDLILLVYSNEKPAGENYKIKLYSCAFSCINSIEVSCDVPTISDADVFCFITTLKNPNTIDLENIDEDQFDALYLILKVANNLSIPVPPPKTETFDLKYPPKKKNVKEEPVRRKPIIVADGLVTMDILKSFSRNVPADMFFCPTSLTAVAKTVLGEYVKVRCNMLNNIFIWAANDEYFHVEVDKPYVIDDTIVPDKICHWDSVGKKKMHSFELDYTQFNETWMKKDYIEKMQKISVKNPYGDIYRASSMAHTMKTIWRSRMCEKGVKVNCSLGVISDGSLLTPKGCPYILPLVFENETYTVNTIYKDSPHVIQEIKRFNKIAKEKHITLIKYCKKFLQDNVINLQFARTAEDSGSAYSFNESSSTQSAVLQ